MHFLLTALLALGLSAFPALAQAQPVFPLIADTSAHVCARGGVEAGDDGLSAATELVATDEVSSGVSSAADDDFVYLSLHLAADPRVGAGSCADDGFFGTGLFAALIDIDGASDGYEVAVVLDGEGADRGVRVHSNTAVTLAGSALDPFDEVAGAVYSLCTHVDVEAEADGTFTLTLAAERDDVLAAANAVLSPDLTELTGAFGVAAATAHDGTTLDADQSCVNGEVACGEGPCPALADALTLPLVVDTFLELHVEEGSVLGSTTPTLTGVAEVGASVEVSDGTSSGLATVESDGRFHFEVPADWGFDGGDAVTLEVTATDVDLHVASAVVDVEIGDIEVEVVNPGLVTGLVDRLLSVLRVDTNAPLGSVLTVEAELLDGEVVEVCTGLVLVLGLNTCSVDADVLFDGAAGTLRATVDPLLGGPVTNATSFVLELLAGDLGEPLVTADLRPTFEGTTNAPDGSAVEVRVGGEWVCVGVVLGGSFACTPDEDAVDSEGEHLVEVTVESASTGTTTVIEGIVDLDLTDPVLSILGPLDGTVSAIGDLVLDGTVADLNLADTVRITVTGDSEGVVFDADVDVEGGLFEVPLTGLADDTYTVVAVATDLAGNDVVIDLEIIIDSGATAVAITSPTAGEVLDTATPTVAGTTDAVAGSDVEVRDDSGALLCSTTVTAGLTWSCTSSVALEDGAHSVTVRVDDGITTPGGASVSFVTDTEPPVLSVDDPSPAGCTLASAVRVTGSQDDTTALDVEVSLLDGATVAFGPVDAVLGAGTFRADFSGVTPGPYTVRVVATDAAGLGSEDSSHAITVSATAGTLDLTAPGSFSARTDFEVAGTTDACPGSDIDVSVDLGGVDVALCAATVDSSGKFQCQVADGILTLGGDYDLTASLDDGLHPVVEVVFGVTLDGTLPAVSITSPAAGSTLASASATLAGAVSDDSSDVHVFVTVVRRDDGTRLLDGVEAAVIGGGWSLAADGFLADVGYQIEVVARDPAGNEGAAGPVEFDGPDGGTGGSSGGATTAGAGGTTAGTGGSTAGTGGSTAGGTGGGGNRAGTGGDSGGTTAGDPTDDDDGAPNDDEDVDSAEVRAGSSIFGCAAGGEGSPGALIAVLWMVLARLRWSPRPQG